MKKYIPFLVVLVLVVSIIGIARSNPVWASPKVADESNAPLKTLINVTANGTSIIGGVCEITATFGTTGKVDNIEADAEVPIAQSKTVVLGIPSDEHLLFPGCHFVFSKGGTAVANPVDPKDAGLQVCFGSSPNLTEKIYYYLDKDFQASNSTGYGVTWNPLPTTLDPTRQLVCAPAQYNGVYMPTGMVPIATTTMAAGVNPLFPNGLGGTVLPPPDDVSFTGSGTYAVGGICMIKATYIDTGLSDTVKVTYPTIYTEDTKTIPPDALTPSGDVFYFPGCRVTHFKDQNIQNTMTSQQGDWQICFAAIPGKTMTIYYYADNTTNVTPPWTPLVSTTANGMVCADPVDFSAIYAPAGH